MGSEWLETTLGETANFKNGKGLKNSLYDDDGKYPVWGANGQIAWTGQLLNEQPVVVIGRVGAYCGSIHAVFEPNWVTDNAIVATPKKGNDFRFLYYLLKYIRPERTSIGSAQPLVTQTGLKNLKHLKPPLSEQRAIAHILGSLDDKIELNRRMNKTLEAMARTIFKSWFVDFDPVRAKAEDSDPRLPDEIAAIFPDSFEDSELGEIPKGWEIKPIGEVVEFAYGKALKASNRKPGNVPVFGSNGPVGLHNEALVKGPGIVIGRKGNPGIVTWSSKDFFPIDTTFYVRMTESITSLNYLFYALKDQDLPSLSADSAVPGLNRNLAYMNNILVPSDKALSAFDKQIRPLFKKIDANDDESVTLASLRDTLLPKLISGELRVPDAEKLVEASI
jgi:type I restriction enzyme S subunit